MNYRRRSARLICVGSYLGNLRNQPYRQLTNHGLPPTTTAGAPRVGGDKDHAGPQRRDMSPMVSCSALRRHGRAGPAVRREGFAEPDVMEYWIGITASV